MKMLEFILQQMERSGRRLDMLPIAPILRFSFMEMINGFVFLGVRINLYTIHPMEKEIGATQTAICIVRYLVVVAM